MNTDGWRRLKVPIEFCMAPGQNAFQWLESCGSWINGACAESALGWV
jgi:hypothetical protein